MPYKSEAQARYFHYLEEKGKISPKVVDEFDEASKGMDLPLKKMALGGVVDEPEHDDDMESFEDGLDQFREEKMSKGGVVKSDFAKAIKRKRGY